MDLAEMEEAIRRVGKNLRVTKVVATRSVKGTRGDHFAGFSATYSSVQDEPAGMGKDLDLMDLDDGTSDQGLGLQDARLAHLMVAMQADIAALDSALANGGIPASECKAEKQRIRDNYGKLTLMMLSVPSVVDDLVTSVTVAKASHDARVQQSA